MINFNNDYTELINPRLLEKIASVNMEYDKAYGFDSYSNLAQDVIRNKIQNDNVDVHFISGGTQTNLIAISSALYTFESVVATDISHINALETGAIEATGHKIYTIPHINGKLDVKALSEFSSKVKGKEFFAVPKLVCITNATEYGTYYTKNEILDIYNFCKQNDMYLFIDGARMASALHAKNNDVKYSDLPNICDMFYFGGTKNGALMGEALVIVNDNLKRNYKAVIKQRGGLMAKSRVMGVQFYELFKDGLYEELALHANKQADNLRVIFKNNGYELFLESETNQVFVILPNEIIQKLQEKYIFSIDSKVDENTSLTRFVTSWATSSDNVIELERDIQETSKNNG